VGGVVEGDRGKGRAMTVYWAVHWAVHMGNAQLAQLGGARVSGGCVGVGGKRWG
jgi:hypothetical protein